MTLAGSRTHLTRPRPLAVPTIAVLVVLALVATACGTGKPAAQDPSSVAADLEPFEPSDVDAVIERLAAAGIGTYSGPDSAPIVEPAEPVSVVRLMEWQARNLAFEAWAGNGQPGSVIDQVGTPPPDGAPTTSQWLAAYVGGVQTPGADYARELLGDADLTDPGTVEFPQLVATLFVSDAAMRLLQDPSTEVALAPGGGDGAPAYSLAAFNPCGDFSNFISEVMRDVLKALHIPPPKVGDTGSKFLNELLQTGANLVVGFLNWAIGGVITILVGTVRVALKPVLDLVASVSSVLAIASQILGAIRPWTVRMIPEMASVHKAVGSEVVKNRVQAIVDLGGLTEWPPALVSCAKLVEVDLPPLKPIGAPVTWNVRSVPAGLAIDEFHLDQLNDDDAGGMSELRLRLGTETAKEHKDGESGTGLVDVTADIRRKEFKELKETMIKVATSFLAGLPAVVRSTAERLLRGPIEAVMEEVVSLVDEHGTVSILVTYHGPAQPTPTPSIPPVAGSLTGTWTGTAVSHFGDTAAFSVDLVQTGSKVTGNLHIPTANCNKESKVSGTVSGSAIEFGVVEGEISSTFSGTVSGSSMSGSWQSPAGPSCRSDYGTWEASKTG